MFLDKNPFIRGKIFTEADDIEEPMEADAKVKTEEDNQDTGTPKEDDKADEDTATPDDTNEDEPAVDDEGDTSMDDTETDDMGDEAAPEANDDESNQKVSLFKQYKQLYSYSLHLIEIIEKVPLENYQPKEVELFKKIETNVYNLNEKINHTIDVLYIKSNYAELLSIYLYFKSNISILTDLVKIFLPDIDNTMKNKKS